MILRSVLACISIAALIGIACSGGSDIPQATPSSEAGPSTDLASSELSLITGPVSQEGLQAIFGTPDLGVGEHRVGFALTSPDGLVRVPEVSVSSYLADGAGLESSLKQKTQAVFRLWPYGTRGLYTTEMDFDAPGSWRIEIDVPLEDGVQSRVELFFDVQERTAAPAVGAPGTPSHSKTLRDVDRISQLTTGSLQDADLYQTSIADALTSGLPSVIVMASPAFCTNAVCGPQVEVLQELKNSYKGRANFIHIDLYDNPEEIQGDLSSAVLSPTVVEWRLPSTEWSFVLDLDGIVSARFEAFATLEELEEALLKVL